MSNGLSGKAGGKSEARGGGLGAGAGASRDDSDGRDATGKVVTSRLCVRGRSRSGG